MTMYRAEFAIWVVVALLLFILADVGPVYHGDAWASHGAYSLLGIGVLSWAAWRFKNSQP